MPDDPSDKRKDSVHPEEVIHNEPGDSLLSRIKYQIKIFIIAAII